MTFPKDNDPLLTQLRDLLYGQPVTQHNPLYCKVEFSDTKIRILGVLSHDGFGYEHIYVNIMQKDQEISPISTKPSMGFVSEDFSAPHNETVVCHYEPTSSGDGFFPIWYRSGNWERYIAKLAREKKARLEENRKLNRKEVDDAELFNDIDLDS